jgi:hypothetical protein
MECAVADDFADPEVDIEYRREAEIYAVGA